MESKKKYLYDAYLRILGIIIGIGLFFIFFYNPQLIDNNIFNILLCLILFIVFLATCERIVVHGYIISIVALALAFVVKKIVMKFFDSYSISYENINYIVDYIVLSVVQIPLIIENYINYKREDGE